MEKIGNNLVVIHAEPYVLSVSKESQDVYIYMQTIKKLVKKYLTLNRWVIFTRIARDIKPVYLHEYRNDIIRIDNEAKLSIPLQWEKVRKILLKEHWNNKAEIEVAWWWEHACYITTVKKILGTYDIQRQFLGQNIISYQSKHQESTITCFAKKRNIF